MKINVSNEVKVGVLATAAICTLYFGFNFLKGTDTFSKNTDYVTVFDNVGSLQASNAVKLNGVQVGKIKSTEILVDKGNQVKVVFEVNNKIPLYEGTTVMLNSELLGGSALSLSIPTGGRKLNEGETVVATKERGIQGLIQEKALPLLHRSDTLIQSLNMVIKQFDQTGLVLNKLLSSADHTVQSLDGTLLQNKAALATTMNNIGVLSASLIETEKSFKPIMSNLKTASDSLKALEMGKTLAQLNATVATLQKSLTQLEQGHGTAGKLLKDEALYTNLNRTVVSMNKLLTNFREYPKRYISVSVFGRKDKSPAESPLDTATLR